jgi:hypothetical protein
MIGKIEASRECTVNKFIFASLLSLILSSCFTKKFQNYTFEEARYNYSTYKIKVNYRYIPGVELIFFDSNIPERSGVYLQSVQLEVEDQLKNFNDVILVDVDEIMERGYPITRIISHEYIHYKQKLKIGNYRAFKDTLWKEIIQKGYDASQYEREAFDNSYDYPLIAFVYGRKDPQPAQLEMYSYLNTKNISHP